MAWRFPRIIINQVEYIRFLKTDKNPGLLEAIGITTRQCLPDDNVLNRISTFVKKRRGKHKRLTTRVDPKGNIQSGDLEFDLDDCTIAVANIAWPVHVKADPSMVASLILQLKADVNANRGQPPTESTDANTSHGGDDDDGDISVLSFTSAISSTELPTGVYWAESKLSFLVKGDVPSKLFRLRSPLLRNEEDATAEIALQQRRACEYNRTGTMSCNPDPRKA